MQPTRAPLPDPPEVPIFHGLNLILELKDPRQMPEILEFINQSKAETRSRMRGLNFVHFARFLPVRGNTSLLVITEFDGLLETYLLDFVIELGNLFDTLLGFVKNAPPLPVRNHPAAFVDFVKRNNRIVLNPLEPIEEADVFSAYPGLSVVDIVGQAPRNDADEARRLAPAPAPAETAVPLADVQANLLRGLRTVRSHHFALRLTAAAAAQAWFEELLAPDDGRPGGAPGLMSAAPWDEKPGVALNLGLTAAGLAALGLPDTLLERFPAAFREGPAAAGRAANNGDDGPSEPARWVLGHPGQRVDLLVSLHELALPRPSGEGRDSCLGDAPASAGFLRASEALRARWADFAVEVHQLQAAALPDGTVHFGYREGMSQPRLAGIHEAVATDPQPLARVGDFLLGAGYRNSYGAPSLGSLPAALCENASFGVVRMLAQDAEGFERLLDDASAEHQVSREYIAAKLMGRWRNGRPLTLPEAATAAEPVPAPLNDFDFRPLAAAPAGANPMRLEAEAAARGQGDHDGLVCPVGAHIRRMNPRSARVAGKPYSRRLIRRGLPYGPAWAASPAGSQTRAGSEARADAKVERGLYGVFYCADIERQFEFIQRHWGFGDRAASGIRGTRDPFLGADGPVRIPHADGTLTVNTPRLVETRGSLYLFVPGLAGLGRLARGAPFDDLAADLDADLDGSAGPGGNTDPATPANATPANPGPATMTMASGCRVVRWPTVDRTAADAEAGADPARFDPTTFDPLLAAFIDDPYPWYARFREQWPVARVRRPPYYDSYWVFRADLVEEVCRDHSRFGKPLKGLRRRGPDNRPIDLSAAATSENMDRGLFYLDPPRHTVAREAFEPALEASSQGIEASARVLADQALRAIRSRDFDAIPTYVNRVTRDVFLLMLGVPQARWERYGQLLTTMLDANNPMTSPAERAVAAVAGRELGAELMQLCPVHGSSPGLFTCLHGEAAQAGLTPSEILQSGIHFALGGYLSTAFLLGTGIHRLLGHPDQLKAFREGDATIRGHYLQEMARFDSPFQTADRIALAPTRLGDVTIPAGALVTVNFGSANRDRDVFGDDAEVFRPGRWAGEAGLKAKANYVFGRGVHYCIGAELVGRVLPIYFDRWLGTMKHLALGREKPLRLGDPAYRGFASLPLQF